MRVLFVCTANVCRSRMAEDVFRVLTWTTRGSDPAAPRHEVRSAGTRPDAGGRPVTHADLAWADVVCVMETDHAEYIRTYWPAASEKVRVLGIPDVYQPGDPTLQDLLARHILALLEEASARRT